jgi:hypothetical protein
MKNSERAFLALNAKNNSAISSRTVDPLFRKHSLIKSSSKNAAFQKGISLQKMFPNARTFVRQGFDEIDWEKDRPRHVH